MGGSVQKKYIPFLLFFLILIPFILITSILLLKDPVIWPDEPIFFNAARNFIESGLITTDIHGKLAPYLKNNIYAYPPLYFYLLGLWIKIFGEDIEVLRGLSVFIGIGTLGVFFYLSYKLTRSNFYSLLSTLYLSLDYSFSRAARLIRMEGLTLFFSLTAFLFLFLALDKKKELQGRLISKENKSLFLLVGLFAGLSLLTHPMGVIAPMMLITCIFFLPSKISEKIKIMAVTGIPILVEVGIWFISIKNSFSSIVSQLQYQIIRKSELSTYLFLSFEMDFRNFLVFICNLSIFLILSYHLFKNRKSIDKNLGSFLTLTGLLVTFILVILSKEMWYIVYIQPFIILSSVLLLKAFPKNSCIWILVISAFLLNFSLTITNFNKTAGLNYHEFTEEISKYIPDGKNVCLTTIPDPYFDLQKNKSLKLYEFLYTSSQNIDRKGFLDNCDLLVINYMPDRFTLDYIEVNKKSIIQINRHYQTNIIELKGNQK